MSLLLAAAVVAAGILGKYQYPAIEAWWRQFDAHYGLSVDIPLAYPAVKIALRHLWQTQVSHQFNQFYDIETTCLMPKYANRIAINYIRLKPGKNYKKDGDDAFHVDHYTYRQMYDIVLRLSYILKHEYGIQKGDTVTLYYQNKALFVFVWFALWNLGAIPAFLNYNLKHNPLVHSIRVVDSPVLLVDDEDCKAAFLESEQEVRQAVPKLKIFYLNESALLTRLSDPTAPQFRETDSVRDAGVKAHHPAVLVYTSGTTGMPKSAVNSWRKCYFAAYVFPIPMKMYEGRYNIYTSMPLYHGTGSILGVLPALEQRGTLSIGHKFSVSTYWAQVRLTGANCIQYVGETCRYLVEAPVTEDEQKWYGKVDFAFGNGLRADIWTKFKQRFGINAIGEFYASSESPFATTCREENGNGVGAIRNQGIIADRLLFNMYTLVKTCPDDDGTIYRNAQGLCEEPGPNEKGEMITRIWNPRRVETTFPGYVNNPEATYSKVIRDVFRKGDAWVRSDDLMRRDERSHIYFMDRMGDTYRWKSENVSTTEVENEILALDEVEYCAVVGCKVEAHEGRCGYVVIQTMKNNTESDAEKVAVLDKLAARVFENLPHFARPVFVRFDMVEITSSHKISKKRFRDPVLPAGPTGSHTVYYLDTRAQKYKLLTPEVYSGIIAGKVRI